MIVSGGHLSLFGRTALANAGNGRASARQDLDPVEPTDPLKDPTSREYRDLQDLQQRDREVRQHEQAHVAAGGQHVRGGPSFTYEQGPDGRQYAIGGEVQIDTAAVPDDPAATISKMQVVRSAALAPADPSAQDRRVAAEASRTESQARVELREAQREEPQRNDEPDRAAQRAEPALNAYRGTAAMQAASTGSIPTLDLIA
jgi:hypothetical protein